MSFEGEESQLRLSDMFADPGFPTAEERAEHCTHHHGNEATHWRQHEVPGMQGVDDRVKASMKLDRIVEATSGF